MNMQIVLTMANPKAIGTFISGYITPKNKNSQRTEDTKHAQTVFAWKPLDLLRRQ